MNEGYTYRERVGRVNESETVLGYLSARHPHGSVSDWSERIAAGLVLLAGAPAQAEWPIREGQTLEWLRPPWREPEAPLSFTVLRRDADLLAVNKPSGLPTLPGGGYLKNTLLALVRREFPEAVPAHRLGRWTSGILLFGLTERARAHLAFLLREGKLEKRYRALACGAPRETRWTIDAPIGPVPHARLGTVHAYSPKGRPARSEVTVVETRSDAFLADVCIATGRPHQIRIHMAFSGHPLVGDPLYPAGGVPDPRATALPGDPGYRLHAMRVRVSHPRDGCEWVVECAPPDDGPLGNNG